MMIKRLQRACGNFIALSALFVLAVLGLGACMNPLQGPDETGSDGSIGVKISIVNGDARTLLPGAGFDKYVLSFWSLTQSHPDVSLTSGSTIQITDLAPATWTIRVKAFVETTPTVFVEAAFGEAVVELVAGQLKAVPIRVSAKLDGANGSFSYKVSWTGVEGIWGDIKVYDLAGGTVFSRDLGYSPSEDSASLPPGYYRLQISLETTYSMAVRSEVIHIYPGMDTRAEYAFEDADFGASITISGTVDLSGLAPIDWADIGFFADAGFMYGEALGL